MHELIDQKTVETIRETGNAAPGMPPRTEVLEKHGLVYDREAENVIVTGCQVLHLLPGAISSLARVLDRGGLSYTFLSREYCCGNYLYRPAIKAKDEEALAGCRELSKEFVALNLIKARELGAKRLVIFCSPCYPIYRHAFPDGDIVFYPRAVAEALERAGFEGGSSREIDYYAGCYRLHRRFSPAPMDLDSTEEVFSRLGGLEVNRIGAPRCCYTPEGASHIAQSVSTDALVTICTGCYGQALTVLPPGSGTEVLMLPEFVERILG